MKYFLFFSKTTHFKALRRGQLLASPRTRCVNLGERVMEMKPIQQRTSHRKVKMSPLKCGLRHSPEAVQSTTTGLNYSGPSGPRHSPTFRAVQGTAGGRANTARFEPKRV